MEQVNAGVPKPTSLPWDHSCQLPDASDMSRGTSYRCPCGLSYSVMSFDGVHIWAPDRQWGAWRPEPAAEAPRPVEDLSQLVARMRRVEDAEYLWQEVDLAGTFDGGVVYQCLHESCPKGREPLCYLRSRTGAQPNDAPVEVLHFHELLIFIRDHLARYHTTDGHVPDLWRPHG